ncbi:MAG TPA: deoxyguanosinetriphosphate triphosphohydrolase [Candidatus Polarisedimenticolia bacterium]|nr:deoxyguanosinetriphosphate triphosphohydrolase [Candidatus Polarisedimenticolia bacterium]
MSVTPAPRPEAISSIPNMSGRPEEAYLAPYAMRSSQSRGRRYEEPEHPFRSPFQRDRDRIIHSRAFRRLEYKTQVFVNHEGDHFRTRLTHSIEVSQVARTVASALRLNSTMAEALSLSHDLGHTPFGHLGEEVLHYLMKDHGGFNHNRQSLRIVEHLEDRYPEFTGLNLTYEIREGIAKHSGSCDPRLAPEYAEYHPEERPPLEAQMIDMADEIAYQHHDVDDGVESGLLDPAFLAEHVPLWGENYEEALRRYPAAARRQQVTLALRGMIDTLVTDLVENSRAAIAASGVQSVADVRKHDAPLMGLSQQTARRNAELKRFLHQHLYRHHHIERMKDKARRIMEALFARYRENIHLLPEEHRAKVPALSAERVICDYIAGMTDRYAMDEYRRLFDPYERV